MEVKAYDGFKGELWKDEINVRNFIPVSYTHLVGDLFFNIFRIQPFYNGPFFYDQDLVAK